MSVEIADWHLRLTVFAEALRSAAVRVVLGCVGSTTDIDGIEATLYGASQF